MCCPSLVGKKGPEVPSCREDVPHTPILLFPSISGELTASPKRCCKPSPTWPLCPHSPSLTRLPAPLGYVGGHLVLGGPRLLQALWAVAVPTGICTQERQSGLWDTSALAWTLPTPNHTSAAHSNSRGHKRPKLLSLPLGSIRHQECLGQQYCTPGLTADPQAVTKGAAPSSLLPGI